MVDSEKISAAWVKVRPYVLRTPIVQTDVFGLPLALKLEHMQHTGSFKARGAMNSLLSMDVPKVGLVAASGGNHGAAVAWLLHDWATRRGFMFQKLLGLPKSL